LRGREKGEVKVLFLKGEPQWEHEQREREGSSYSGWSLEKNTIARAGRERGGDEHNKLGNGLGSNFERQQMKKLSSRNLGNESSKISL